MREGKCGTYRGMVRVGFWACGEGLLRIGGCLVVASLEPRTWGRACDMLCMSREGMGWPCRSWPFCRRCCARKMKAGRWAMREKSGCHAWAMHGLCWTKVGLVQCCFGLAKMDLKKKVKGPGPKKKLTQDNKNKIIIINKIKR